MMKGMLLAAATPVALPSADQNGGDDIAPARLAQLGEQARAAGYHIMDDKAVKIAKANGPESRPRRRT